MKDKIKKICLIAIVTVVILIVMLVIFWQRGIFILNSGEAKKYEVRGVDVSEYQGEIDWKQLEKQNIDFAFIKVTEGSESIDDYFVENFLNADQTDLVLGGYHFFSFDSDEATQASNYINALSTFENIDNIILPIVDIEFYGDKEKNLPDKEEVIKQLKSFLEIVESQYHTKPIIYTTQKFYALYMEEFNEYPLWIRNVFTKPKLSNDREWIFWQYTDKGKLEGYNGEEEFIDLNVFNGTRSQFYESIQDMKIQKEEETKNITKTVFGKITKIEGNTIYIEENQEEYKINIDENLTIENTRTQSKMELAELKVTDEIYVYNATESQGELIPEDGKIKVTRNLKGEELKEEVLSGKEINVEIKELKTENNNAIIIGELTAFCNSEEYETFEVEILVDENTVVLANVENKIEELQTLKERGDTLYITLRESEKQKGNLVADNIEIMGC